MNVCLRVSLGALTSLSLLAASRPCLADGLNQGKGIAGGAFVGAEVVMMTEAAIGVKPAWAYIVGGAAGAGGGAVLGYYIGNGSTPEPSSFLLAGGIALAIPAAIAVITATSYEPPDTYRQESAPEGEPGFDDEPAPVSDAPLGARLTLPSVGLAHAFSQEELHELDVKQVTELHLSVLRGVF